MASSSVARVSVFLVLVLSQSLLPESLKINAGISTSSSSIMIALNLHVKLFPSRNTPGFSHTSPATQCSLSYKITQSLYIARVSLATQTLSIDVFAKSTDHFSYKLKQKMQRFATSNHLEQLISSPTRISEKSSTAIDLIFPNISHGIVDHGVIPSVISDHFVIYCSIKFGVPKVKARTIEYRSYRGYTH